MSHDPSITTEHAHKGAEAAAAAKTETPMHTAKTHETPMHAAKPAPEAGLNWTTLGSNWKEVSAKMQEKWTSLTDDDLKFVDKNTVAVVAKLRERTGLDVETAEKQLDALLIGFHAAGAAHTGHPHHAVAK